MRRRDFVLLSGALAQRAPPRGSDERSVRQHEEDCRAVSEAIAREHTGVDAQWFLLDCGVINNVATNGVMES